MIYRNIATLDEATAPSPVMAGMSSQRSKDRHIARSNSFCSFVSTPTHCHIYATKKKKLWQLIIRVYHPPLNGDIRSIGT